MYGVYIDQIGAAPIQLCFDEAHGHELGNGNWWVAGYDQMMEKVHCLGNNAPIVTEDNAEVYMNQVEGYLTLVPFGAAHVGKDIMTPAFASVYGGYYIGFGDEWLQADFDDKDWWRAKLAREMVFGISLGWFGLGGQDDDQCGNMRLVELFMDEANADINSWIVEMAKARGTYINYFLNGRVVGGLDVESGNKVLNDRYNKIYSTCWSLLEEEGQVGCVIVNSVDEDNNSLKLAFDLKVLGFASGEIVTVDRVDSDGSVVNIEDGVSVDDAGFGIEGIVVDRDTPTMVRFTKQ